MSYEKQFIFVMIFVFSGMFSQKVFAQCSQEHKPVCGAGTKAVCVRDHRIDATRKEYWACRNIQGSQQTTEPNTIVSVTPKNLEDSGLNNKNTGSTSINEDFSNNSFGVSDGVLIAIIGAAATIIAAFFATRRK